jgi:type II secretory ATPase GspE/PulE/Tfp pilus assembly ATPase PilB-like protein
MTLDARLLVDQILSTAAARQASDIHIEPMPDRWDVRVRVDGLLEKIADHDPADGRAIVTRLAVMAQLLTYRLDVPQEGRLTAIVRDRPLDLRLSLMPTTHGVRAVLRLPGDLESPRDIASLGLLHQAREGLEQFTRADAGMMIITGPAGSGKTTTIYAILQHIAQHSPGLSIIALEDPVERHLRGVTQIEVQPFGELTYERALRSILRQDPQVLMLGEIRDATIASLAVQAALSGHRMICTLHAGSPAGAIARLIEMGLEPYQITSALYGVLAQRLVRRKTADGYRGRVPVAEFARLTPELRRAILDRADVDAMSQAIERAGHQTMRASGQALVEGGITDESELSRVLGTSG